MKTLRQFLAVMGLAAYLLVSMAVPVSAQTRLFPLPGTEAYGGVQAPTKGDAAYQFQELIWGIVQNTRFVLGAVAIAFMVYSGFRMVTAWGNEEVYTTQRRNLFYCVIGLAVVGLSGEIANIFAVSCPDFTAPGTTKLACTQGGFLKDPNSIIRASTLFSQRTKIVITFIKYLVGSITILFIVRSGLRLITMSSKEETITTDKKSLAYSAIGLLLIILADNVITKVFYKLDLTRYPSTGGAAPGVDAARGVQEIVGFTNFAVSIIGPIAVLMLLAGGIMYITAAGKEDQMSKAKKLILAAVIGIVIMLGAFAIVSTFISGNIGEPPATTEVSPPA